MEMPFTPVYDSNQTSSFESQELYTSLSTEGPVSDHSEDSSQVQVEEQEQASQPQEVKPRRRDAKKKSNTPTAAGRGNSRDSNLSANKDKNDKKVLGSVKLDQGYKSVLRPLRKALQKLFEKQHGLFKGRHHWDQQKWFLRVRIFLEVCLNLRGFDEAEVAAIILLLYPAFGPSSGTEAKKEVKKNSLIFQLLQKEGMELFKTMITDNNNDEMRRDFFGNNVIRRLWPILRPVLTRNLCFPRGCGPNKSILPTYRAITHEMNEYGLPMPDWWIIEFPPLVI